MRPLLLLLLPLLVAAGCRDLSGQWRNSKGSIITLEQRGHHLHGTFSTAVETSKGNAGKGAVHIKGFVHEGMVSYSIKYASSVAAFTGQCYDDANEDTIHVSWLLHSKQDTCEDNWLATRTGQDKFVRHNSLFPKKSSREDV